jgi:hypothetical protein
MNPVLVHKNTKAQIAGFENIAGMSHFKDIDDRYRNIAQILFKIVNQLKVGIPLLVSEEDQSLNAQTKVSDKFYVKLIYRLLEKYFSKVL